jgi:hypothetical protein
MKKLFLISIFAVFSTTSFAQFSTETLVNDELIDQWDGKIDGKLKYDKAVLNQGKTFVINDEGEAERTETINFQGKTADEIYASLKDWLSSKDTKDITFYDDNKRVKINYYSEAVGVILKLTADTKIHVHFVASIDVKENGVKLTYKDLEYLQVKTHLMTGGFEQNLNDAKHYAAKLFAPFSNDTSNPMMKGYCLTCVHFEKMKNKIQKIINE